jgi:hypothetical protein
LGVIIAAGGAGLFFGMTKSGKIGDLKTAKETAETDALRANQSARDADKKAKDAAKNGLAAKGAEISNLKLQLQTASQRPTQEDLQNAVDVAKAASSSQIQTLQNERDAVQDVADQVPTLQNDLAAYTVHGTAKEIKAQLDELKKLKEGAAPPPVKQPTKAPPSGEIAEIINYDQLNGFYTLNRGSDIGIQEGAKFTIFRNARAVGKIVIKRVRPTVSIANFDPALGKPPMPFKAGDKVMKLN